MPAGNRAWCFTLNNPTEDEKDLLPKESDQLFQHAVSLCYQLEAGASGTPHIQGYVRFSCQRSLNIVRSLIPRAHWEPAKGTPQQNLVYCTKADGRLAEPVVIGQFGGVGGGAPNASLKRGDFLALVQDNPHITTNQLIDAGGLDVLCSAPNLLGIARGYLLADERGNGITCRLFVGPTGTGKSRLANHLFPLGYRKVSQRWWDGYAGESTVIFDDFDGSDLPIADLLQAIDRYSINVPVKGGFVKLVATNFIITSNLLPREWYPLAPPKRINAIHRRISEVIDFSSDPPTHFTGQHYLIEGKAYGGDPYPLPWLTPDPQPEPEFELTPEYFPNTPMSE